METEKLLLAAEISEYLHTLEGLQPLVWHQARGVAERIAEIAIAHLMDCTDVEYWQRQTERFPASTYVWVMFRRAKAHRTAQLPTDATPNRGEQTDFRALAVRVLRQHRRCGDAYPEDGWPEVNAALAQYALEKRYPTVSAAGQRESGPKGDMPENEDVVDMVPCALCNHPKSRYCPGCVEFSNFEPRKKKTSKKMCEICGIHPATVPDRERMGRLINRVCGQCHALRLAGDLDRILILQNERRKRLTSPAG